LAIIFLKFARVDVGDVLAETLDREAQARGEVLLVPNHHVDMRCDRPVDTLRCLLAAVALPERSAIVEII
jgi:hypothetical protein